MLRVVEAGATPEQARRLLDEPRVKPPGSVIDDDGLVSFVDGARFQHLLTRWKQELDGLHDLLGFNTLACAWHSFSGELARNLVDHSMKVRQVWFDAVADEQPDWWGRWSWACWQEQ